MVTINVNSKVDVAKTAQILLSIQADKLGGWFDLPRRIDTRELSRIIEVARKIQSDSEYLVCIGIGGSYLGHRAIIEALQPNPKTKIVYAGNSLSRRELKSALDEVGDHDFSVNVISKSGTTLEPLVAFDAFKKKLVAKYGPSGAAGRIYATTDANSGMLHDEAVTNGYTRFVIPDNIGGRYSVLTPVGLLPMAVAGIDIDDLISGAMEQNNLVLQGMATWNRLNGIKEPGEEAEEDEEEGEEDPENKKPAADEKIVQVDLTEIPAVKYAWARYSLGANGFDTEIFATFEPSTAYFNEWLKQLFGESEGKNGRGVWPSSVVYSTDLHSLGQFMQEGRRNIWETIIDYPTDDLNAKVITAVRKAHMAGGLPVLTIQISTFNEKSFGELVYFFELSCALSAKLFGVNPFDQPGVEMYKNELKKLIQIR